MEAVIPTEFSTTPPLVPFNVVVVLLVLSGLVLLVAAVRLLRVRLSVRREESRELPPLIYAPNRANVQRPAPLTRESTPAPVPEQSSPVQTPRASDDQVMFDSTVPPVRIVREPPATPLPAVPPPQRSQSPMRSQSPVRSQSPQQSQALQALQTDSADADTTLQLLPGRLEPTDPGSEQEIRFIRVPGSNRFTLGRDAVGGRTHIQLKAKTASRMHAFMVFEDGGWRLGNMSQTNPVVVNGTALNGEAPRRLADGDRIEFGELTFVFRER